MPAIRPAAVAGKFYPGARAQLAADVRALLDALGAPGAPGERSHPKALIVPHAGYVYSGAVAASGYARLLPGRAAIRRVVLLGPAHHVALRGLALPGADAFETPLGRVPVDCEALARLRTLPQVRENAAAHATNVDLKGFTDEFYRSLCGAQLQPVLDTLVYLVRETQVWTEITTLLIPGRNDSDAEIEAEAQWIARELGPDVPLHFTAFHPDYKLTDIAGTPPATLTRARAIAEAQGLRYVYTGNYSGNVHDAAGGTTSCPGCREPVIVRDWHEIRSYALDPQGRCTRCGAAVPGRYESFARPWGRRRVPIRIGAGAPANE